MGFIVCFTGYYRSIWSARAGVVQYILFELIGLVLGAFISALVPKSLEAGGPATIVLVYPRAFMIGALIFLDARFGIF